MYRIVNVIDFFVRIKPADERKQPQLVLAGFQNLDSHFDVVVIRPFADIPCSSHDEFPSCRDLSKRRLEDIDLVIVFVGMYFIQDQASNLLSIFCRCIRCVVLHSGIGGDICNGPFCDVKFSLELRLYLPVNCQHVISHIKRVMCLFFGIRCNIDVVVPDAVQRCLQKVGKRHDESVFAIASPHYNQELAKYGILGRLVIKKDKCIHKLLIREQLVVVPLAVCNAVFEHLPVKINVIPT